MFRSLFVVDIPDKALGGVIVVMVLSLGGCGQDGGYGMDFFNSKEKELKAADSKCSNLYSDAAFSAVRHKMVTNPDEIPTKSLLSINVAPTPEEVVVIKRLDAIADSCAQIRSGAGFQSSATDDIFTSRSSKLRYGLYTGEIPYSVYNYGMARAIKEKTQFALENAETSQRGEVIGKQLEKEARQQEIMQMQFDSMDARLDDFYRRSTYNRQSLLPSTKTTTAITATTSTPSITSTISGTSTTSTTYAPYAK